MIKSNIRLVISIAKNYQGAGMNLQDLVQVIIFFIACSQKIEIFFPYCKSLRDNIFFSWQLLMLLNN